MHDLHTKSNRVIFSYHLPGDIIEDERWNWSINFKEVYGDRDLKSQCIDWCNEHLGKQANWAEPVKYKEGIITAGGWNNYTWYFGGNHTFHFHKFNDAALFWIVWG